MQGECHQSVRIVSDYACYTWEVLCNLPIALIYLYHFTRSLLYWFIFPSPPIEIKPKFNMDLSNRLCVVVGGATGIGREIVIHLFQRNAKIIVLDKCQKLIKLLFDELENNNSTDDSASRISFIRCDLSDSISIRSAADQVHKSVRGQCIQTYYMNAGIPGQQCLNITQDGFELVQQVNAYGHLLLFDLLVPLLQEGKAQVVVTGSISHGSACPPEWSDLSTLSLISESSYSGWQAYAQAKFILSLMILKYSTLEAYTDISFFIADPLGTNTQLNRAFFPIMLGSQLPHHLMDLCSWVNARVTKTPLQACESFVALGYDERFKKYSGTISTSYKPGMYHWMLYRPSIVNHGYKKVREVLDRLRSTTISLENTTGSKSDYE